MRIARLAALALLLACTGAPEPEQPPTGRLHGRLVVRGAAGITPVANARVALPGTSLVGWSGSDGRFGFERLPDVPLRLVASAGAHAIAVDVPVGDLGDVELAATGGVSGAVTAGGAPKAGARVLAQGFAPAVTGADGTFSITGLPPGTYDVVAVSGSAGALAAGIVVKPGETTPVALAIEEKPGTVAGRVVAGGAAPSRIAVSIEGGGQLPQVTSEPDGTFAAATVPPGVYSVRARREGFEDGRLDEVGIVDGSKLPVPLVLLAGGARCGPPGNCSAPEPSDAGEPDGGSVDPPDAGEMVDAGTPDAGAPDAGPPPTCEHSCGGATPRCGPDLECHECLVDADCPGASCLAGLVCSRSWREVADAPDTRWAFPYAWDSTRGRLLVGGGSGGLLEKNDLWAFDPETSRWARIGGGGLGAVFFVFTCSQCGFYDAANDRFVVIGLTTGLGDGFGVWAAPAAGGRYTELGIDGEGPNLPPAASVYDAKHRRAIHLGRAWDEASQSLVQAVWALNLPVGGTPSWTRLEPTGAPPPGRDPTSAIYDPDGQRLVLNGGRSQLTFYEDTWALSLPGPGEGDPAWTRLSAGGGPAPRDSQVAVYDNVRKALVTYGGDASNRRFSDTWAFDLSPAAGGWTQLATTGPTPGERASAGGAFDGEKLIVTGGHIQLVGDHNDVWSLDAAGSWTRVVPQVGDALDRAVAFDGARVVFAGSWDFGASGGDVVAYSLADRRWSAVEGSGPRPSIRMRAAAAGAGDRIVLFGGMNAGGLLNDVWSLDGEAWTRLHDGSGTAPAGRTGHSVVHDAAGDRLIVFGGLVDGAPVAETWALSLAASGAQWETIAATGPDARAKALAAYDADARRMLVLGGEGDAGQLADLWALDLAGGTWARIEPGGVPPIQPSAMVYVPGRKRLLVYDAQGATPSTVASGETDAYAIRALDLGQASPAWVQLCPGPGALPPPIGAASVPTGALLLPAPNDFALYGWSGGAGGGLAPLWSVGADLPACP